MGALQGWLGAVSIADVLVSLVWIGGILVGLRWLKPVAEGIRAIAEDWTGRPARFGVPAVPGVMERLASMAAAVDQHTGAIEDIRHQVTPNTGTSAHDAVMRSMAELREMVADLAADFGVFKRDYVRDLHHNHPGYHPGENDDQEAP